MLRVFNTMSSRTIPIDSAYIWDLKLKNVIKTPTITTQSHLSINIYIYIRLLRHHPLPFPIHNHSTQRTFCSPHLYLKAYCIYLLNYVIIVYYNFLLLIFISILFKRIEDDHITGWKRSPEDQRIVFNKVLLKTVVILLWF